MGGRAVVGELKNKLFLPQGCEGRNEEMSLLFPPQGGRGKDEHPNLKQKSKHSIRKAELFLGSACFKGYQPMATDVVVVWNEEVCLRFIPAEGLSPVIAPHFHMYPFQPLRTPILALGLLPSPLLLHP